MSFFTRFIEKIKGQTIFIGGSGTRSRPKEVRIEREEICSAIIDTNATHISKGQVLHVVKDKEGRIEKILRASEYTKLFARPNNMMSGRDFMYAMAWQLQLTNTAIAWVKWDSRMLHPLEIWPLVYLNFEVRELKSGMYAVQFLDTEGQQYTLRMEDLVVLRRKYDGSGYSGTPNYPVTNSIEMVNSLDDGLRQALLISNKINGVVKHKNAMLKTKALEGSQESFEERMQHASEHGGILALDAMEEYMPLNISTWSANAAQSKQITDRIYTYWRTPEEVVRNTAPEQTMQNYYDSIVEPVWQAMEEAFTNALFTTREQGCGNCIVVYSGAATGASWQTKLNIVSNTKDLGLLTVNEYRELLGYSPVEDGDDRLVSLNYVKSTEQSKYQTGTDSEKGEENEE